METGELQRILELPEDKAKNLKEEIKNHLKDFQSISKKSLIGKKNLDMEDLFH